MARRALAADVLEQLHLDLAASRPGATRRRCARRTRYAGVAVVSNTARLCGPRYQSRASQPIGVGSSGGSSAIHGGDGAASSRSSGIT